MVKWIKGATVVEKLKKIARRKVLESVERETGWAYSGPDFGAAKSTVDNAETYWKDVGCALFGKKNVFWYTLRDANPANKVKFAVSDNLSTTPRFDISCPKEQKELPSAEPVNNGTSSGGSSSGNTTTGGNNNDGGNNSDNGNNGGSDGGSESAQQSGTAAPSGTGAGAATSVSVVNSMAMGLSVVFAIAAWAL